MKSKRFISFLMVLVLCLSLLPFGAFAAETVEVAEKAEDGTVIAFGDCGDNVTWTLSDAGVLTISGSGPMEDCEDRSLWNAGICDITKVIINRGVTSIGNGAFCGYTYLASITIPDSVTYIGKSAFLHCSSLTSITIPDSVTHIGEMAFCNCSSLTSITIPDSVTCIEDYAFWDCSSLARVTMSNSVTSIANDMFCNCSSLTSVTIPSGVTYIGVCAFCGCSKLSSITLPNTLAYVDEYAFDDECVSLRNIYYSGSQYQWRKIDWTWGNDAVENATVHYGSSASYYTVTFNANGGSGGPTSGKKYYNSSYTIPSTKPTRSGYTFLGWAATKSATTAKYKAGYTYSTLSSDTLYAVWKKNSYYTVTFNANGGSGGPTSGKKYYNQSYTIPSTKPTRYGYTFLGWAATKSATTAKYKAGYTYSTLSSTTLYAVWKAKTYTVKYYANGGTGAPASGTKTYGKSYTIPSTKPTRTGYTFLGWATSSTATTAKYKAGYTYSTLSSATLYAVWQKNSETRKIAKIVRNSGDTWYVKTYEYDKNGLLVKSVLQYEGGPDTVIGTYSYNGAGMLTRANYVNYFSTVGGMETVQEYQEYSYEYDASGRVVHYLMTGDAHLDLSFEYNGESTCANGYDGVSCADVFIEFDENMRCLYQSYLLNGILYEDRWAYPEDVNYAMVYGYKDGDFEDSHICLDTYDNFITLVDRINIPMDASVTYDEYGYIVAAETDSESVEITYVS